jgi:hypothetical protein
MVLQLLRVNVEKTPDSFGNQGFLLTSYQNIGAKVSFLLKTTYQIIHSLGRVWAMGRTFSST